MMISLWVCCRIGGFTTEGGNNATKSGMANDHKHFTHFKNVATEGRQMVDTGYESRNDEDLS